MGCASGHFPFPAFRGSQVDPPPHASSRQPRPLTAPRPARKPRRYSRLAAKLKRSSSHPEQAPSRNQARTFPLLPFLPPFPHVPPASHLTPLASPGPRTPQVIASLTSGVTINMVGLGSSVIGLQARLSPLSPSPLPSLPPHKPRLSHPISQPITTPSHNPQATTGLLFAKTLSVAAQNPYLSGGAYNPVLALDIFLVQARGCAGSRVAALAWGTMCWRRGAADAAARAGGFPPARRRRRTCCCRTSSGRRCRCGCCGRSATERQGDGAAR